MFYSKLRHLYQKYTNIKGIHPYIIDFGLRIDHGIICMARVLAENTTLLWRTETKG